MKDPQGHGYGDESEFEDSLRPSDRRHRWSLFSGDAPVTKILVLVTSLMWVAQILLKQTLKVDLVEHLGLKPNSIIPDFELWRLVTMMLLHEVPTSSGGGVFHILFNMFTLWVFGREVERSLGAWRFLRFYLLAGLVASLIYVTVHLFHDSFIPAIGASGAVMGVLVLFACLYPDMQVLAFLFVPMKAKHLVMLLVALDFLVFVVMKDQGVANSAHLGGAAFGFVYFRYASRVGAWIRGWEDRRARKERDRERAVKVEVDELLAKISRDGMTALTPRERRFLKDASRRYRTRQE